MNYKFLLLGEIFLVVIALLTKEQTDTRVALTGSFVLGFMALSVMFK